MKKFLALSLVLVIVLAACGGGTPAAGGGQAPAAGGGEQAPAGEQVTLQLWFWDAVMTDAVNDIIADFRTSNPDIDINISVTAWADYWLNLQTSLPAGAGPDMFWTNHPEANNYMPSGLLMDLEGFNLDLSGFDPMQYQPFTFEGRLYGVPKFFDTIALFYNKAIFDEAGVPHPPHRGWTWEDALEAGQALTVIEAGEVMQFGLGLAHGVQTVTGPFTFQAGGHIFNPDRTAVDINNPGALEAFRFIHDAMFVHRVSPNPVENATLNVQGALFVNRMMAMEVHGMWRAAPYFEALGDDLGIAHLPRGPVREANTFHNIAYVVSAATEYPDAVAAFLRYATTAAHGDIVAPVFLPSHNDSQHLWFENFPTLNLHVFAEAMEFAEPLQVSSINSGPVFTVMGQEFERAFMENEEITAEVMEEINTAINTVIQSGQ